MSAQPGRIGERPEVIQRVAALVEERRPDDHRFAQFIVEYYACLLYTSDAADEHRDV